jgi:hypothetical protein
MANKLIELIDAGKVRDLESLKRFFRRAAKRSHPDAVGSEGAARAFISLREDYEEALRYLEARLAGAGRDAEAATGPERSSLAKEKRRRTVVGFDRRAFYIELQDLFARGFPLLPKARAVRPAYESSRSRVSELAAAWQALPLGLFERLESELAEMGARLAEAHTLTAFRSSVYSVLDYHNTGFSHLKVVAKRLCEPIRAELSGRGRNASAVFLEALVSDLERGSALAEEGKRCPR